jgi:acyl carrier protein
VSDLRATVLEILAELFGDRDGVDVAGLTDASDLAEALDMDSMDVVDLAMELENRLNAEIEGKPSEIKTLAALLAAVEAVRPS